MRLRWPALRDGCLRRGWCPDPIKVLRWRAALSSSVVPMWDQQSVLWWRYGAWCLRRCRLDRSSPMGLGSIVVLLLAKFLLNVFYKFL